MKKKKGRGDKERRSTYNEGDFAKEGRFSVPSRPGQLGANGFIFDFYNYIYASKVDRLRTMPKPYLFAVIIADEQMRKVGAHGTVAIRPRQKFALVHRNN